MGICLRREIGPDIPDHIAGAVVAALTEMILMGQRLPCTPLVAECYPEGAVIRGECGCARLFHVILMPSSVSIHEKDFVHRWGHRQSVPIQSKEGARN